MKVGILKELKHNENRVAMTPAGADAMRVNGHKVYFEPNAGAAAGFPDADYVAQGAVPASSDEIFAQCDLLMHVKEPQPSEYGGLRKDQMLFTYLHLAADEEQTRALIKAGNINIAYETIQKKDGSLPLLTPMSEVAGRISIQQAAKYLEIHMGGMGKLIGGLPGVEPGTVVIVGGGVVGVHAAKMACGLGAKVYLLDINLERLRYISDVMPANCITMTSCPHTLRQLLPVTDVLIGAVLIPGAKTPRILTREDLKLMRKGSVLVDVAIDQGGCFETSRPTTHADPVFTVDGVLHYCVGNIPSAVAVTSTMALTNATLPYALTLANMGWKAASQQHEDIRKGVNVVDGKVTCKAVADVFGMPHTPIESLL